MGRLIHVIALRQMSLTVLAFAAAMNLVACRTSDSETKDNQWAASSQEQYAAIRQNKQTGYYYAFFYAKKLVTGVKVCFDTDAICRADAKQNYAMQETKTANGLKAFVSTMLGYLVEGESVSFYINGQAAPALFKVVKSANGELDLLGVETVQATTPKKTPAADPLVPNPRNIALNLVEKDIIRESNRARQMNGLAILPVDPYLMDIARRTAQRNATYNMANQHSGANTFENVYYAQPDARSTVFGSAIGPGWLYHTGHRENLLNPGVRGIGASMSVGANGVPHWVQNLL